MKVIKRDGHTVTYDRSKIITAIKKANAEVEPCEKVTDEKIEEIVQGIESKNRPRILARQKQKKIVMPNGSRKISGKPNVTAALRPPILSI